jgi:LL-H family phage holin
MNMDDRLFQLILVLGTIITVFIIPLLKEKIDADKLAKYKEWANLAVKCAEMLWTETGHGADKKQYVVDYLNNMFNSKKTVITEEQLNVLIESAVQSLNTEK